jgi:AAA+ superfamily predicted ATPase
MLDGYRGRSLILASTNHEGMLDKALWRRFDEIFFFDRPNIELIRRLLELKLRSSIYDLPIESRNFLQRMEGLSHSDIERIVIQSIKQTILKGRKTVDSDIFEEAIKRETERKELMIKAGRR